MNVTPINAIQMSKLASLLLLLNISVAMSQEGNALVTFYSTGCAPCGKVLATGTVASATGAYYGSVYDDHGELIKLMRPNQFVTLKLTAGPHEFMGHGLWSRKPNEDQALQLTLDAGKHYFIHLGSKTSAGFATARKVTPIFLVQDCNTAFSEGAKTEPLRAKYLGVEHIKVAIGSPYFPTCPSDAP